jgi:hypothetical protein
MIIIVVLAAAVLVGAWLLALRAQLRRSRAVAAEWSDTADRPHLWTSQARCLSCGAAGGVVDDSGGRVSYLCLRCGDHRTRDTRG